MGIALKAEDVSIRYITGDFKDIGIKEYATRKLTNNYHVKEFMAVDGVSFALENGDMLGIIGANGAGKSTLLKAVAGIMEPTRGKITAHGEVAALLELGSGFDGDLTVRENAYLRGAMLGYTKEFMDETYAQIIDFAELREFEDRPFKQLSSGMKSRLAFSIASLVDPDILILDEVLSVGDGAFQEKSAQKMREIIAGGATTILVSHSLDQIRELCNKVLWLDHGRQVAFGEAQEICDRYERFLRGECPAAMEDAVQTEAVPAVPAPGEQQPPAALPKGRRNWVRAGISAVVLGLFAAMLAFTATNQITANRASTEELQIYADMLGGGVTYRGAAIGDTWYSPTDTVTGSDGWTYDEEQATYTASNEKDPLTVRLPVQSGRTVTFNAGPEQGRARLELSGGTVTYDLSNPETVDLGLPHDLPDVQDAGTASRAGMIAAIAGLLTALAVLALSLRKRDDTVEPSTQPAKQTTADPSALPRVKSIDGLRGILAVIIALFHFGQIYPLGNTFHRGYMAVEVFFMLSGFLLIAGIERKGTAFSPTHLISDKLRRLYPAYLVSVLALVMLYSATWFQWNPMAWLLSDPTHPASLIAELLAIQVTGAGRLLYINGPVWYVSALLLATAILALLYAALGSRRFRPCMVLLTAGIYITFFFFAPYMDSAGYLLGTIIPVPLLRGITGMGAGCCVYWIYRRFQRKMGGVSPTRLYFAATISMVCLLIPMIWTEPSRSNYLLFIPAASTILCCFWLGERKSFFLFESRPLQYLGKVSYTFFVLQSFCQNFVSIYLSNYSSDPLFLNVCYLLLDLLLTALLYPLLEVRLPRALLGHSTPSAKGNG